MQKYWVVIETGENQLFIFDSSKQIVNVGASDIIRQLGEEWVPEFVGTHGPNVQIVVAASGKAILIAPRNEAQAIISAVTRRALKRAPGLQVWGVIGTDPLELEDENEDAGKAAEALDATFRLHASWRSHLPHPALRAQMLPFLDADSYTGRPSAVLAIEGKKPERRSAQTDKLWRNGVRARTRLATRLADEIAELPDNDQADKIAEADRIAEAAIVSVEQLGLDGISTLGWTAVLHADGNGVGALFLSAGRDLGAEGIVTALKELSSGLDAVTWRAFALATRTAHRLAPERRGWLLPIIVGGDDLTVVLDASRAQVFTQAFLEAFDYERTTGESGELVRRWAEDTVVTAAAGLAVVGDHHPFSHAYALAEELVSATKAEVKSWSPHNGVAEFSAYDVHVLFESTTRSLDDIRAEWGGASTPKSAWAGPIVIDSPATPHFRGVSDLADAIAAVRPGTASAPGWGRSHRLREAFLGGDTQFQRVLKDVIEASSNADGVAIKSFVNDHVLVKKDPYSDPEFSRLLTAIDLADIESPRK